MARDAWNGNAFETPIFLVDSAEHRIALLRVVLTGPTITKKYCHTCHGSDILSDTSGRDEEERTTRIKSMSSSPLSSSRVRSGSAH